MKTTIETTIKVVYLAVITIATLSLVYAMATGQVNTNLL